MFTPGLSMPSQPAYCPPCRHRFGEGLELIEQQWLVSEVNDFIASMQVGQAASLHGPMLSTTSSDASQSTHAPAHTSLPG